MKIYVHYTWYRGLYNYDSVTSFVILRNVDKSKRSVTQAIRDWTKEWTGRGYIRVSSVGTAFKDDEQYCDIAQKKFCFSN